MVQDSAKSLKVFNNHLAAFWVAHQLLKTCAGWQRLAAISPAWPRRVGDVVPSKGEVRNIRGFPGSNDRYDWYIVRYDTMNTSEMIGSLWFSFSQRKLNPKSDHGLGP